MILHNLSSLEFCIVYPDYSFELSIRIMVLYCQWEYGLVLCRNWGFMLSESHNCYCLPGLQFIGFIMCVRIDSCDYGSSYPGRCCVLSVDSVDFLLYDQVVVLYYMKRLWLWCIGLMIYSYCDFFCFPIPDY